MAGTEQVVIKQEIVPIYNPQSSTGIPSGYLIVKTIKS